MIVLHVSTVMNLHIVTGHLNIIRDAKLRALVENGPSLREQNPIYWKINYLHELQSKYMYVLVPADKVANNIMVMCKKDYLEVVLKELRTTSMYVYMYKHVDKECMHVHVL